MNLNQPLLMYYIYDDKFRLVRTGKYRIPPENGVTAVPESSLNEPPIWTGEAWRSATSEEHNEWLEDIKVTLPNNVPTPEQQMIAALMAKVTEMEAKQ